MIMVIPTEALHAGCGEPPHYATVTTERYHSGKVEFIYDDREGGVLAKRWRFDEHGNLLACVKYDRGEFVRYIWVRDAVDPKPKTAQPQFEGCTYETSETHLVPELRKRIAELEAALNEIAEVADVGFADAKSSCRTEAKAIAHAARQALKQG